MDGSKYTLENTGWCLYEVVDEMTELEGEATIRNRRSQKEKVLHAGEKVIVGRPLLCTSTSADADQGARTYRYEGKNGALSIQGNDEEVQDTHQTFSVHLIVCRAQLEKRGRHGLWVPGSRKHRAEFTMPPDEVEHVTCVHNLISQKKWTLAMDTTLDRDDEDEGAE